MRFTKMQGVGNDFVILDPASVGGVDLPGLARRLCDRRFGVGGDGILIPAPSDTADFEMVYLNSDGSTSEMCGNGLRCLARYARDSGLVGGDTMTVETGAGIKRVVLRADGSSRVEMGAPTFEPEVEVGDWIFFRVSMGNPHAVAFLDTESAVGSLDLGEVGPPIECNRIFPDRTNVEFAYVRGPHEVRMRIWERGAGETLASGSGSCATAVAAIATGRAASPVRVIMDGGEVGIEWSGGETLVYMTGPAEYVFSGTLHALSPILVG
jgi:diaminopimelate epimerase